MSEEAVSTGCTRTKPLGLAALIGIGITAWGSSDEVHHVPFFPAASEPEVLVGFVRIINHDHDDGEVHIQAIDDSGYRPDEITLTIGGGEVKHFNSEDLEGSDATERKGLSGSVGMSQNGDWRLEMTSSLDIEVLAYARHPEGDDGFLTSMHDTAPSAGRRHRVAVFNPGSNENQVSLLRLVNPGEEEAHVEVVGIDDRGHSPEHHPVEVTVGARQSRTFTAKQLEVGEEGEFEGKLGDGAGKWRLDVTSRQPILVMSLMHSLNRYTNLSTAPATEFETAMDVFDAVISEPIVQSKCVNCHVEGGASSHTPLVFVTSADRPDDHRSHNFDQFKDYLADDDHGDHDHEHDSPRDVILDKIQGNRAHGGGEQVEHDSDQFHDMERFLTLLEDEVADDEDHHGDE